MQKGQHNKKHSGYANHLQKKNSSTFYPIIKGFKVHVMSLDGHSTRNKIIVQIAVKNLGSRVILAGLNFRVLASWVKRGKLHNPISFLQL